MIINFNEPLYTYDNFINDVKRLTKQYDGLIKYVTIGSSHDNRDIVLLKLGYGKKTMLCCAGVHARETVNPIVMMGLIEYYAELYTNYKGQKERLQKLLDQPILHLEAEYKEMLYGACIFELLQTFTILFVPLLNPDGYMISLKGFEAINNQNLKQICIDMKQSSKEWKYNARGIDINRNFPCRLWKPKSDTDYAASENETKALITVFHQYKTKGFLDFHSRGKSIYYYRSMMSEKYNDSQLKIAKRLIEATGYDLYPPEDEIDAGDSGGNTVHYYSEHFYKPALTIETVEEDATFPLDNKYRKLTFEELKLVIFEFGSLII